MRLFVKNSFLFFFLGLVFYILLQGCNNSAQNNENVISKSNIITAYAAAINSLQLPLKDTCYDTLAIRRLSLPDSLSKFKKYGEIVGKIDENRNYVAVLYAIPADIQLPVLQTFNKDGKEISSLKLFIGNCCGENEDCSGLSSFQITKDLHIILKDSMQTFERNKNNSDKKRNIETHKKVEEFKIDSTGNILPVNSVD